MTLAELGWDERYQASLDAIRESCPSGWEPLVVSRVVRQDRGSYQLLSPRGRTTGILPGNFSDKRVGVEGEPCVGDWVLGTTQHGDDLCVVRGVLERTSVFSRKAAGSHVHEQFVAANVDKVFLVSGLDHDFNIRRMERYLTLAKRSGARAVVVLNKADLVRDVESYIERVSAVAPGVDVVAVSTVGSPGIDSLLAHVEPAQTYALLGSSGVGKSSILNAIEGGGTLRVQPVREDDSRGRHTTTARELFVTQRGALIIDTPGMRELQLWAESEDVDDAFPEILALAEQCRFADCAHDGEPGCAVHQALDAGQLDGSRLASYLKLQRETAWLERRISETPREQRERDRALGRMYREIKRYSRKNKGR